MLGAAAVVLAALCMASSFARILFDSGDDIAISQDSFEVAYEVYLSDSSSWSMQEGKSDGLFVLTPTGTVKSGAEIPLCIDIYYQGESYSAVRLLMLEQWYGTSGNDSADESVLPEKMLDLQLANTSVPLSDNRTKDQCVYLSQYQSALIEAEADTSSIWNETDGSIDKLCFADEVEAMYTQAEDGSFKESESGTWRKYSICTSALVPELTDETDSVMNPNVTTLTLYLRAEAALFNRKEELRGISEIPAQTNISEEESE